MRKILTMTVAAVMLTACGSTSGLRTDPADSSTEVSIPDLSKYDAVWVVPFEDGTEGQDLPKTASTKFVEEISLAIREAGVFDVVSQFEQEVAGKSVLKVGGTIDRLDKGDTALRLVVGFGAGSSYFDATVNIVDGESGEVLGAFKVDKNSNPLGGWFAVTQSPDSFMSGAARKIAKDLANAKQESSSG